MSHPVLERLRDADPEQRRRACEAAPDDPSAVLLVDALAECLGDSAKQVARAASRALTRLGRQHLMYVASVSCDSSIAPMVMPIIAPFVTPHIHNMIRNQKARIKPVQRCAVLARGLSSTCSGCAHLGQWIRCIP